MDIEYKNDAKEKWQSYEVIYTTDDIDYQNISITSYGQDKEDMLNEFSQKLKDTKDILLKNIDDINNIISDINNMTTEEFGNKYFKDNKQWNTDYKELNMW